MFKKTTRDRIRSHKWSKHSNESQFFKRIKKEIHLAIKDITLTAKEIPEEQLKEIFTVDKLRPLTETLLKSTNQRTIQITEMMAFEVWQKLSRELPTDMVNNLGGDIGKTWIYAKLLSEYADKPLLSGK